MSTDITISSNGRFRSGSHRKLRPIPRAQLDHRTTASKRFDATAQALIADLGGEVSAVQQALIRSLAGLSIQIDDMNARAMLGQPVMLRSTPRQFRRMTRVASRLGLKRQSKKPGLDRFDSSGTRATRKGHAMTDTLQRIHDLRERNG